MYLIFSRSFCVKKAIIRDEVSIISRKLAVPISNPCPKSDLDIFELNIVEIIIDVAIPHPITNNG
jgi:hypothetical protein